MNRFLLSMVSLLIAAGLSTAGYAQEVSEESERAIRSSQKLDEIREKIDFLLEQTRISYESGKFQEVVDLAGFILKHLDSSSADAKDWLEKGKAALAKAAQEKLGEVKEKLGLEG